LDRTGPSRGGPGPGGQRWDGFGFFEFGPLWTGLFGPCGTVDRPGLDRTGPDQTIFNTLCIPDSLLTVRMEPGIGFMFCAPGLIFDSNEGGPVFMFCAPELAVPRARVLVFMFYPPEPIFGCTLGVGFSFHILRSQTRFRWCRGSRVQFSCFALPDPFLAVTRVRSLTFNVLCSLNHFQRYRARRV
jgi:hypothetical protein